MTLALTLVILIFIVIIAVNIWTIREIAKVSHKKFREKWLWTNIVIFLPIIGVIAYFLHGKERLGREDLNRLI